MGIDLSSRMLIEWQCSSIIHRAAYFQDMNDIDSLANLYAEDAEYHSNLGLIRGREKIGARYGKGLPNVTTRHVVTNILFLDVQEGNAEAVSSTIDYFTVTDEERNPFSDAMLFEVRDQFRKVGGQWLIRSRAPKMVFAPRGWLEYAKEKLEQATAQTGPDQASS